MWANRSGAETDVLALAKRKEPAALKLGLPVCIPVSGQPFTFHAEDPGTEAVVSYIYSVHVQNISVYLLTHAKYLPAK